MAAVVRIKRRLEDEPLEALILNCKRQKIKDVVSEAPKLSSTLLTLSSTVKENENILSHINHATLKENFKSHSVDLTKKLRDEHQEKSKNNRYKIVNCRRSNLETNDENVSDKEKSAITIVDIEPDVSENAVHKENESREQKYVYDLYYTSSDYLGDAELEQEHISIYPLKDPLFFSPSEDQLDSDIDSEDSNAENNWRNDYPDEEDMLSVNEDDIVQAMNNVELEDDLLSSDEGEEAFVYGIDSEGAAFDEEIDESDVHRYGKLYAKFKAKNKSFNEKCSTYNDLYYGDIDDEDDDYDDDYDDYDYGKRSYECF